MALNIYGFSGKLKWMNPLDPFYGQIKNKK
jgi:hypothetical protein